MGYSRPHSRHLRPLTKLMIGFLSSLASGPPACWPVPPHRHSLDRGPKEKAPCQTSTGLFSKPFRSCLAVFYVEQVALNRHVLFQHPRNKAKSKGISTFEH